ncbi:MAG: hypothetical protein JXR70_06825 [Spirochaetales bacterium]|nr:hypothetical protein [Spirochaetales bacterium]
MKHRFFKTCVLKRFFRENFPKKTFEGGAGVTKSPASRNEVEVGNAKKT